MTVFLQEWNGITGMGYLDIYYATKYISIIIINGYKQCQTIIHTSKLILKSKNLIYKFTNNIKLIPAL